MSTPDIEYTKMFKRSTLLRAFREAPDYELTGITGMMQDGGDMVAFMGIRYIGPIRRKQVNSKYEIKMRLRPEAGDFEPIACSCPAGTFARHDEIDKHGIMALIKSDKINRAMFGIAEPKVKEETKQ